MSRAFVATHTITIPGEDPITVLAVDGALYTQTEWERSVAADWEIDESGKLTRLGETVPGARIEAIAIALHD